MFFLLVYNTNQGKELHEKDQDYRTPIIKVFTK